MEISREAMLRLSRAMDTDNRNGQGDGTNGPAVSRELASRPKNLHVGEIKAIKDARARIAAMQ